MIALCFALLKRNLSLAQNLTIHFVHELLLHMDALFFLSPSLFLVIPVFVFLIFFHVSYAEDDALYTSCGPFDCGNLPNLSYPFWIDKADRPAYCGFSSQAYKLRCIENQPPVMTIRSQEFHLVYLNQIRSLMTIQRVEFGENTCPEGILVDGLFNYSGFAENVSFFYECRIRGSAYHNLTCKKNGIETFALFFENTAESYGGECGEKVQVPVEKRAYNELMHGSTPLNRTLAQPFDIRYVAYDGYCRQCKESGGRCGSNVTSKEAFACYCRDRPYPIKCEKGMPASCF